MQHMVLPLVAVAEEAMGTGVEAEAEVEVGMEAGMAKGTECDCLDSVPRLKRSTAILEFAFK